VDCKKNEEGADKDWWKGMKNGEGGDEELRRIGRRVV
jgi:hypothetical protein